MGYRLDPRVIELAFPDPGLNVMKVKAQADVPLSVFFDIQVLMASEAPADIRDACLLFGNTILKSWDVQDDEGDVPSSGAGFLRLPMNLAIAIMAAWTEAVGSSGEDQSSSPNGISQSAAELIETGKI
jgi:hypothetical protein